MSAPSLCILYLCEDAGISVFGRKGASTHIREVCRSWLAQGHRIHMVCAEVGPDRDPSLEMEITQIAPLRSRKLGSDLRRLLTNRRFARALPAIARQFKPHVIYERHSLYTGAGLHLARRLGVPHMLEANALLSDEQSHRLRWHRWAARRERAAFEGTDCLITVSPGLSQTCRNWGASPEKIHTLPMAVDPERFLPRAHDPARRSTWGWSPDAIVVGYLGALTGWHRPDLLLEAVSRLREDHPAMRLLFVGGAPKQIADLQRLAAERGLGDRVVFTGAVPHGEVPALLAEFDIGVVPGAHQWSMPTKMMEYWAMSIPLVAPATLNLRSVVEDDRTGLLFTPDDPEALAGALSRALRDAPLRRRLAEEGREQVLREHTWMAHGARLIELCQELVR
jgi:glycosyltransferase involved in cell wall biosynthesis